MQRNRKLEAAASSAASSVAAASTTTTTKVEEEELRRLREIEEEHIIAKDRIATLEEQLVENARSFAAELAEVKMKVFELEAERGDFAGMLDTAAPAPLQTDPVPKVATFHARSGTLINKHRPPSPYLASLKS